MRHCRRRRGRDAEGRDALEGTAPGRRPQKRVDRRLEEVAKAVGGGYCRLQMPLSLAPGVKGTVAGHRLGVLEGGGGLPPPVPMHPWPRGCSSAGEAEGSAGEAKNLVPLPPSPHGESAPAGGHAGAPKPPLGRGRDGGAHLDTPLANGESSCPPSCGPNTEQ